MNRVKIIALSALASLGLGACAKSDVDESVAEAEARPEKIVAAVVGAKPEASYDATIGKPGAPFSVSYKVIGTPIIGSPVTVELRVESALGPRPMTLNYRINDSAAMVLAESQLASVRLAPAASENFISQQVTIVPQRVGRSYLNVSASIETEEGTMSTVTAIPIQVGSGGRELLQDGEIQLDENGEAVRVLTPAPASD